MTQAVVIKSKSYGIHLVLNEGMDFAELSQAVIDKFKESGAFFKNAKIGISFEGYPLTDAQEYALIDAIESNTGIEILCIMEDENIREACVMAKTEAFIKNRQMQTAMCHRGTIHPGEALHADSGLLIFGDVEKGAKVTAKGSIVVFGALEGLAQAGLCGDSAAYIAALSIDTGQLQIGNILYIPQAKGGRSGFLHRRKKEEFSPQIARVQNGHVIMEPYTKDLFGTF